jgi:two-component system, chemotaxis family, chemotaxis protein CheY
MARIMIVDDAGFMRMSIRKLLTDAGYEVVGEAASGTVAVKLYKELQPDLVTMDITMPEMNGIECVREIVKLDPKAKIIMCSAMGQRLMVLEAIEAGARDFIVKPFVPQRVLSTISSQLA